MQNALFFIFLFLFSCFVAAQDAPEEGPVDDELKELQEQFEQENPKQKQEQKGYQQPEEQDEPEEKKELEVKKFFEDPGLALFPKDKHFSLRNVLSQTLVYNDNVFLVQDGRENDTIYTVDLESQLTYKNGPLVLNLIGGVGFEKFFEQEDLDQFLPRIIVSANYNLKSFYCNASNALTHSSQANAADVFNQSETVSNSFTALAGYKYQEYFFEASAFHNYTDFKAAEGDFYHYGGSVLAGYKATKYYDLLIGYKISYLDHKEGLNQEDNFVHSPFGGIRLNAKFGDRTLTVQAQAGLEFIDDQVFVAATVNADWLLTRRLALTASYSQGVAPVPNGLGDFQFTISGNTGLKYLINRKLALVWDGGVSHTNPDEGDTVLTFSSTTTLIYRFYRGVDISAFHSFDYNQGDDADDSKRHIVGASLAIIF